MFNPPLRSAPQEHKHVIALSHKVNGEFVPIVVDCTGRRLRRPNNERIKVRVEFIYYPIRRQGFRGVHTDGYAVVPGIDYGIWIIL